MREALAPPTSLPPPRRYRVLVEMDEAGLRRLPPTSIIGVEEMMDGGWTRRIEPGPQMPFHRDAPRPLDA
jgi:hypothetical protein